MSEWRDIPGYEGRYEVSEHGEVRRLYRTKPSRTVKPTPRRSGGYLSVCLCVGNRPKTHFVHRLVMLAFVGPCPDGMEVCHGDGDKLNNALSNLRYDERIANVQDRVAHGTLKLTPQAVREIRDGRLPQSEFAKKHGVSRALVSMVQGRKKYAWVA
jgi:DNA-binding transcriptional regulator YiaG